MSIKKTAVIKDASSRKTISLKKEKDISKSKPKPKKNTKAILVDVIEDDPETTGFDFSSDHADSEAEKTDSDFLKHNDNTDLQKEYFSGFSKVDNDNYADKLPEKNIKQVMAPRKVTLYRNLVIKFLILVGILAIIVFYFSFSKLIVSLSLRSENVSNSLLLKVIDTETQALATSTPENNNNDPREKISGVIKDIEVNISKTYLASGESNLGEEISGQVRIINNYNKSQVLVATTRLLSPGGELFRIKEAVTVPAGGEVVAEIYADKPEKALAINPTSFTIPGLWLGLQDKIYAKSEQAFIFSEKTEKYITAEDLESAAQDIKEALLLEAKNKAEAELVLSSDFRRLFNNENVATISLGAKRGDKLSEFTATATSRITVIAFPVSEVNKLAAAKLNLIMPDDKEISDFKTEDIQYSLESYSPVTGAASVKATFNAAIILKNDASLINPEQLVNLNAGQIEAFLKERPEVKDYQLKFYPSFIKKAPSLVDRIKIEIN